MNYNKLFKKKKSDQIMKQFMKMASGKAQGIELVLRIKNG